LRSPDNPYNVIRYANSAASDMEAVPRSTSRLPNPVFCQSPLQFSSLARRIPSESRVCSGYFHCSILKSRTTSIYKQGDITCRGDCCYGQEFFPSARGRDAHANIPFRPSRAFTPSQSSVTGPKRLPHGTPTHPVSFTDDAKMELGDRIRRQCFNCRTTATKAWRRSVLGPGKMICLA
jgi:hypothetical protein